MLVQGAREISQSSEDSLFFQMTQAQLTEPTRQLTSGSQSSGSPVPQYQIPFLTSKAPGSVGDAEAYKQAQNPYTINLKLLK